MKPEVSRDVIFSLTQKAHCCIETENNLTGIVTIDKQNMWVGGQYDLPIRIQQGKIVKPLIL